MTGFDRRRQHQNRVRHPKRDLRVETGRSCTLKQDHARGNSPTFPAKETLCAGKHPCSKCKPTRGEGVSSCERVRSTTVFCFRFCLGARSQQNRCNEHTNSSLAYKVKPCTLGVARLLSPGKDAENGLYGALRPYHARGLSAL